MRVILLGHRGFVGAAFSSYLASLDVELIGIDRSNYGRHRGTRADIVINAAGSSDRRLASANPAKSFDLNVAATLASCLDFPCDRYIHISTAAVYDRPADPQRNDETALIDPLALGSYGLYKYLGEVIVRTHTQRRLILRLGPLVGPGLRKNAIFDLLTDGKLYCHPDSMLQYIDTRFVAQATWLLRDTPHELINVCGSGRVRLEDLARERGLELRPELYLHPRDDFNVNIDRLKQLVDVPNSTQTVAAFAYELGISSARSAR